MPKPTYVALEGVDGTGKSTVLPLIVDRLEAAGRIVRTKPEFPEGRLDEEFREALLRGLFLPEHLEMAPQAAFFYLLYADTFALTSVDFSGADFVVADRCHYTHSMYQAYFASTPRRRFSPYDVKDVIETLYRMFGLPLPDEVFILQAPEDVIIERLERREARAVRAEERETLGVFSRTYDSFVAKGLGWPVDASRSPELVADSVAGRLLDNE